MLTLAAPALAALAFSAYASRLPASETPNVIAVNVVTRDGRPVPGAVVLLFSGSGAGATHQLVADLETDDAGRIFFFAPPGKTYHLAAGAGSVLVEPAAYDFVSAAGYSYFTFVAAGMPDPPPKPKPAPRPKPCRPGKKVDCK